MKQKQDIPSFECEWDQYPFKEYNYLTPCFDSIERVQYLAGKEFTHEEAIEDHWMNATNDYDVRISDYCRMTLYLVEKALKIKFLLQILQQDSRELLDPLFSADKIGE